MIDHLGLTAPGQSWRAIEDGRTALGGSSPVNPSGGLIGGGHPVGATGVLVIGSGGREHALVWRLEGCDSSNPSYASLIPIKTP